MGKGVVDDQHSYAFDGQRCLKWHNQSAKYGKHWKAEVRSDIRKTHTHRRTYARHCTTARYA